MLLNLIWMCEACFVIVLYCPLYYIHYIIIDFTRVGQAYKPSCAKERDRLFDQTVLEASGIAKQSCNRARGIGLEASSIVNILDLCFFAMQ